MEVWKQGFRGDFGGREGPVKGFGKCARISQGFGLGKAGPCLSAVRVRLQRLLEQAFRCIALFNV